VFDLALRAGIPMIGVSTDDPVNLEAVLQSIAKIPVRQWTQKDGVAVLGPYLYWTSDPEFATPLLYKRLVAQEKQLVFVNILQKPNVPANPLIYEAGVLALPEEMLRAYLKEMVESPQLGGLVKALRGLSLRAVSETVMIAQAKTGELTAASVRQVRTDASTNVPGLYVVDTDYDFYITPEQLETWIKLNKSYFLHPKHPKLTPRGILLDGYAGVGKSMAAQAIARNFGVPLFRLDIATTLNKFIGESEARVSKILQIVEREAPCLLLIDEAEKLFQEASDTGVTQRILSQLLWWLQNHTSQVFTVMTTNKFSTIPPELYRPGRVDTVMKIARLTVSEGKAFAQKVFKSIMGEHPSLIQTSILFDAMKVTSKGEFSHAEITALVIHEIKEQHWFGEKKPLTVPKKQPIIAAVQPPME
jgi:hypothetical protein